MFQNEVQIPLFCAPFESWGPGKNYRLSPPLYGSGHTRGFVIIFSLFYRSVPVFVIPAALKKYPTFFYIFSKILKGKSLLKLIINLYLIKSKNFRKTIVIILRFIMYLLKILAFVATITAINNYHGTNQKQENRFSTNRKAAVIILAQKLPLEFLVNAQYKTNFSYGIPGHCQDGASVGSLRLYTVFSYKSIFDVIFIQILANLAQSA
jgi:hypothetical protein